jgi:chromosome segregation ATPase
MNEQQTQDQQGFFTRIGNFFRRGNLTHNGEITGRDSSDLPLRGDLESAHQIIEPRTSLLRPWARRDAAIANLQAGFDTLTDLMSGIKSHLDQQGQRQSELMSYLSSLPQVMQMLPESNRMQGEALRAIQGQLEQQNSSQDRLASILEHMGKSDQEQKSLVEDLHQRVESFRQQDEKIAENLGSVSGALHTVVQNSQTTTQVLQSMRDDVATRDDQLEQLLHKQQVRFTTMLAVAIFLSVAAVVAVSVVGYLLILKK